MQTNTIKSITSAALLGAAVLAGAQAGADQRTIVWVGPDDRCDYPTLQDAIASAPGAASTLDIRLSLAYRHSASVRLPAGVEIRGGFNACRQRSSGTYTAMQAPSMQPLFVLEAGSAEATTMLSDLALWGDNFGPRRGGVVRMEAGATHLVLDNVVIRNGNAVEGGAVFMAGDENRLVLRNSQLADNDAALGGGIYCGSGGTVELHSGRIENNTADAAGGGLFAQPGCSVVADADRLARIVAGNRVRDQEIAALEP